MALTLLFEFSRGIEGAISIAKKSGADQGIEKVTRLTFRILGIFTILLFFQGCGELNTKFKRYSSDVIKGFWDAIVARGPEYTGYTVEALSTHAPALTAHVPSDVQTFCPTYEFMDSTGRTAFWVALISAVAKYESGFNSNARYSESFSDSSGRGVVSRGLLQLSLESVKYYGCDITTESELHDANKNLSCGVRILNKLVMQSNSISTEALPNSRSRWAGAARYWSVLRPGHKLAEIRRAMLSLAICRP